MSLFKKKPKDLIVKKLNGISFVTGEYSPCNGEAITLKATKEGEKQTEEMFIKAEIPEDFRGVIYGYPMIAKVDAEDDKPVFENIIDLAHDLMKSKQIHELFLDENHNREDTPETFIVETAIDWTQKAWKIGVDVSGNSDILKKAKSGDLKGFSIDGLRDLIAEKIFEQQTVKANDNSPESAIIKATELLQKSASEVLNSSELNSIDKKGYMDLAISKCFDLVNKEIDTIFNTDVNNKINKNFKNNTEESEMKPEEIEEFINKALDARDKRNEKIAKAQGESDATEARFKKLEDENIELKKAIKGNGQAAGENGDQTEAEKLEKAQNASIFGETFSYTKNEGKS